MLRSAAILLVLLLGATDALAHRTGIWAQQQTQRRLASHRLQQEVRRPKLNPMRQIQQAEQRAQADRIARPTAMRPESPFVRPSRVATRWDSRGLGLTAHVSAVRTTRSIYERLHASPVSIRSQLELTPASHGGLVARILHLPAVDRGASRFRVFASADLPHEAHGSASPFLALKGN